MRSDFTHVNRSGEVKHADVIWTIKDDYIGNTFFDVSASAFLLPELSATEAYGSTFASNNARQTILQKQKSTQPATATDVETGQHKSSHAPDVRLIIEFRTQVERISKHASDDTNSDIDWPLYVTLSNGKTYGCDFVVSATGVIPNTSFLGPEVNMLVGVSVNSLDSLHELKMEDLLLIAICAHPFKMFMLLVMFVQYHSVMPRHGFRFEYFCHTSDSNGD